MLAAVSAAALLTAGAAIAQTTPPAAPEAPVMPQTTPAPDAAAPAVTAPETAAPAEVVQETDPLGGMTAEELVGRSVVDTAGNSVGEVNDLMLDAENKVASVMIDVGGFLGIGERTVALEASSLTVQEGEDGDLVTSMTKEQIEALPAYEKVDDTWRIDAD
jgi:sporulation protein YlmC with PRC-barrel domain